MSFDPAPALERMRTAAPLVQNITNFVAMNTMANVLLAAGASPAMVHAREESTDFMTVARALTINIGTLTPAWVEAMHVAANAAKKLGKPWVFDPVGCGATPYRTQVAKQIASLRPTIIRGNASEILALSGVTSSAKGVDAGDEVDSAQSAAKSLVSHYGSIVCITGPVDLVTDGTRIARIANGHPLMPRVTALGCALTGICAAFAATTDDPFEATTAALAFYGACGEIAAKTASGPGTFAVAFIDALANMNPATLTSMSRVSLS
ncbi:MAG: hydroxyethylthiazole kinase [Anderseniella sp.]